MAKPSPVKAYLAQIGSQGGKKSRRVLTPAQAKRMVAVREARKAFRQYRHEYFWSYRDDMTIRFHEVPFVFNGLKAEGNRETFEMGRRLHRLWKEALCP
jgi:hypothetical protein